MNNTSYQGIEDVPKWAWPVIGVLVLGSPCSRYIRERVLIALERETHDRLSRIMMSGVDPKVIYRVNRAMDNPDPWSNHLNRYMRKSGHAHTFDIPGLRKYGHREPNHNWMSAMMTGYMYGEKEGMYAAAANHLMQDFS
jgi:hypothetical protein